MSAESRAAVAAALVGAAATRGKYGDDLVSEVWTLVRVADGFAEVLDWLDNDSDKYHPMTIVDAEILSVDRDEAGCPVRWREYGKDGRVEDRDAFIGPTLNPVIGAVLRTAMKLAGSGQHCVLKVAYEPGDGKETTNGRAPAYFRRVVQIVPRRRPDETARSGVDSRAEQSGDVPPTRPVDLALAQHRPEPEPVPAAPVHPATVGPFADVLALVGNLDVDTPVVPGDDVFREYTIAWNRLAREGQAAVRAANDAAGKPVGKPQKPETVGEIHVLAEFAALALVGAS